MNGFELLVDGARCNLRAGEDACEFSGRTAAIDLADLGRNAHSVIVDGIQHTVHVTASGPGLYQVAVNGSVVSVEVRDPRRLSSRSSGNAGSGRQQVRAPMPGRVLAVNVSKGDRVESGQGLVIVEAMKMQNELRSPRDGRVAQVCVKTGDSVASGDALVVVE